MNDRYFSRLMVFVVLSLFAGVTGCSRKETASSAPPPELASTTAPPGTVTGQIPAAATAPPPEADVAALLQLLTQQVRKYGMEQRRVPATLEELVAKGYLAQLPAAPAGKRFAINKNLEVYLATK